MKQENVDAFKNQPPYSLLSEESKKLADAARKQTSTFIAGLSNPQGAAMAMILFTQAVGEAVHSGLLKHEELASFFKEVVTVAETSHSLAEEAADTYLAQQKQTASA